MLASTSFFVSTWAAAPAWINWILVSAGVFAALGVIRAKIFRPLWQRGVKPTIHLAETVPPLRRLAEVAPELVKVAAVAPQLEILASITSELSAISSEFRNNGGGSMRDAVDRIEETLRQQDDAHNQLARYVHSGVSRLAGAAVTQIDNTNAIKQTTEELRAEMAKLSQP